MAEGCSANKGKRSREEQEAFECIRNIRLAILATPKHLCTLPKGPNYQEPRSSPPAGALRYIPTKRIKYLARPKPVKAVTKFKPAPAPKHIVKESTLRFIPTKRIVELAQPANVFNKLKEMIEEKTKQEKAKKRQLSKQHEEYRKQWLESRAAPKPASPKMHIHPVVVMFKGKRMFVRQGDVEQHLAGCALKKKQKTSVDLDLINKLAIPTRRTEKYRVIRVPDRFVEKRAADLLAPLSERLRKICAPKALPEEALLDLNFQPFTVSKAAQNYVASVRIAELAEARDRSEYDDDDVAEDAFTVPRRALKAICSKRTAELAQPIMRD